MTKVAIAPGDYAGLHKEVVSVVEGEKHAPYESTEGISCRSLNLFIPRTDPFREVVTAIIRHLKRITYQRDL